MQGLLKKKKIGIGPIPTVNARGHKLSLQKYGYDAETFVDSLWYFTNEFDIKPPQILSNTFLRVFLSYFIFFKIIFRYKIIYHYFNGIAFRNNILLNILEPYIFKIANIKSVVLSYGMDVQDLKHTNDLLYKSQYIKDYPDFRFYRDRTNRCVKNWINNADFIISGCDWVKYSYYWDKLLLSHFVVEKPKIYKKRDKLKKFNKNFPMQIGHAPNHHFIKGTNFIKKIIENLKKRNFYVNLNLYTSIPNDQFKKKFVIIIFLLIKSLLVGTRCLV